MTPTAAADEARRSIRRERLDSLERKEERRAGVEVRPIPATDVEDGGARSGCVVNHDPALVANANGGAWREARVSHDAPLCTGRSLREMGGKRSVRRQGDAGIASLLRRPVWTICYGDEPHPDQAAPSGSNPALFFMAVATCSRTAGSGASAKRRSTSS